MFFTKIIFHQELDDVDNHPQDALASLEERIEAKLAEAEAEEAAAHLEEVLEDSNPSLDPVDDCIASVRSFNSMRLNLMSLLPQTNR